MVTKTIFRIVKSPSSCWASSATAQNNPIDESLSSSLPTTTTTGGVGGGGEDLIYRGSQNRKVEAVAEPARLSTNNSSHHVVSSDDHTLNTCDEGSINALDTNSKKRPLISENTTNDDNQKTANKRHRFNKIDLTGVPPQPPIPRKSRKGTSKYKGVSFCNSIATRKKWRAQISIKGIVCCIGQYEDEVEAAVAYARAVYKYKKTAPSYAPLQRSTVSSDEVENYSSKMGAAVDVLSRTIDDTEEDFSKCRGDVGETNMEERTKQIQIVIDGKRYIVVRCDNIEEDENAAHYVRAESLQEAGTGNGTLPVHSNAKESAACYGGLSQSTSQPVPNPLGEDAPPNERIMNSPVRSPSVTDGQQQQQQMMAPQIDAAALYNLNLQSSASRSAPVIPSQLATSAIAPLLSGVCESQNYDIVEVWIHDDERYHLAHSYVRPTLEQPLFSRISDVYRKYVQGSAAPTHRLSCALCKWAKKTKQILRVSESKSPRLSLALKHSVSGVQTAVAVPVCQGDMHATIALFRMTNVELPKNVEDFQDCYLHLLGYKLMILMKSEQALQQR